MKITIECDCGNKVELKGNHATFDITESSFDCYTNDESSEVRIECDKCNAQHKLNICLTDWS